MKTEHNGYTVDATDCGVDIFRGKAWVASVTREDILEGNNLLEASNTPPTGEAEWLDYGCGLVNLLCCNQSQLLGADPYDASYWV